MTLNRLPNESLSDYKFRLLLDKAKGNISESWKEVAEAVDPNLSESAIRIGTKFLPEYEAYIKSKLDGQEDSKVLDVKYKESVETLNDGSIRSDKLIQLSKEDMLKPERIMELHGYDPKLFELTNSKHSMWNVGRDGDTLYSSKVTVKPIKSGIDFDKIIEKFNKEIIPAKPLEKTELKKEEACLEIPLFDMHFGIADFEYYKKTYDKIVNKISSKHWDKIVFIISQDLLHNDGFTSQTTSGTIIDKVDMQKAWNDAAKFYIDLIKLSDKYSNNVLCIYSSGNHDQAMGWAFVRMLEATFKKEDFPNIEFDTLMKPRKFFVWKDIFVGTSHGDKSGNKTTKNFITEFGRQMAIAKVVEIHQGHIHHELTKDDLGVTLRSLATAAKTDEYHDVNGWIGAHKRFQLFEYSPSNLEAIYYI